MVRFGIIGMGNMGQRYYQEISAGMVRGGQVRAVYTGSAAKRKVFQEKCAAPLTIDEILNRDDVDAVIIATPNRTHAPLAEKALENGKHVLVEKPAGLELPVLHHLVKYAAEKGLRFGVMYQMRVDPVFVKIRQVLKQLGRIERIHWEVKQYYRPQSYYDGSGSWDGSFQNDGGGVLLNQAIHQLDLWQYLFGMPKEVVSGVRFGGFRDIEVEDQATVLLRYEEGLVGVFMATVNEEGEEDRLEVVGERGRILLTGNRLKICMPGEVRELDYTGQEIWQENRIKIVENFVESIHDHKISLISPVEEGVRSLELVSAIWQSALEHRWVGGE